MMVMTIRSFRWLYLLIGFTAPIFSGCGGDAARFKPAETTARQALDTALSAWKSGDTSDAFASQTPKVRAVDSHWQAGRRLAGYEVLKEESGAGNWRFSVRIAVDDPNPNSKTKAKSGETDKEVTYVVFGQEPVWVYRDEDYARFLNMDDNPQPLKKAARPGGRSR